MGDIIFNILWWALAIWTGVAPNGYAPYLMLGFNIGDLMATLYFGVGQGYLKEDGDFNLGAFLLQGLLCLYAIADVNSDGKHAALSPEDKKFSGKNVRNPGLFNGKHIGFEIEFAGPGNLRICHSQDIIGALGENIHK